MDGWIYGYGGVDDDGVDVDALASSSQALSWSPIDGEMVEMVVMAAAALREEAAMVDFRMIFCQGFPPYIGIACRFGVFRTDHTELGVAPSQKMLVLTLSIQKCMVRWLVSVPPLVKVFVNLYWTSFLLMNSFFGVLGLVEHVWTRSITSCC